MTDLKAQLTISADSSGVEAGVGRAKRSIATLGKAGGAAGLEASRGIDRIGAASMLTSRSIDRSIGRLQLQAAVIGKNEVQARLFELRARGASTAQLQSAKAALTLIAAEKSHAEQVRRTAEAYTAAQATAKRYGAYLATAGLAAVVGTVVEVTKRTFDALGAFNDLSDASGASIENISALDRVARETGSSFDAVSTTLIKFNQALTNAGKESAEAAGVLRAIGLNAKELRSIDPAEALRRTAVALSGFANDGEKARAVQILFGKSIKEAAPLLNDLAEKSALVATTSGRAARDAEVFNKQLSAMRADATDAARALVSGLVPALSSMAQEFLVGMNHANGFFDALTTFGTINPFRSLGGNLKALREELEGLEDDRKRYLRSNSDTSAIDQALETTRRKLEFLKDLQRRQALSGTEDTSDFVSRRFMRSAALPSIALPEEASGKASKAKAGLTADPDGEAKRYLESLQRQIEATQNLTTSEQLLRDLQLGRLGKVSSAMVEQLSSAAKQVDLAHEQETALQAKVRAEEMATQAIRRADEAARDRLLQATEVNQSLREEIEMLGLDARALLAVETARLSSAAALKEEELARLRASSASTVQIESLEKEIALLRERSGLLGQRQDRAEVVEAQQYSKAAAAQVQQDLAGAISGALQSTDPIRAFGDNLFRVVNARVSDALADALAEKLLGSGDGGFVSGLLGAVLGGRANGGPVSANSIYRVNERGTPEIATLGGKDYLLTGSTGGKVTPNPHGSRPISVVNHFAISGPVDRRTQDQIAMRVGRATQLALSRGTA